MGDGKLDFVVAHSACSFGPGATVYLGNGDGTFTAKVLTQLDDFPIRIVLADFNGDGKLDLAAVFPGCNGSPIQMSVLMGNGDGTFQRPQNYSAGREPEGIAAGDFNGDGKLDLIVGDNNFGYGNHYLYLGNGDGTFQPGMFIPLPGVFGDFEIHALDVNGDGNLDIVFAGVSQLGVQLGNGDGTFSKSFVYPLLVSFPSLTVGDINGDGKPDVIAVFASIDEFLGNGDGSMRQSRFYSGTSYEQAALGDLGNDGIPDLAVTDARKPPDLNIFRGKGNGTFFDMKSVPAPNGGAYRLALGDFNNDGLLDIVSATPYPSGHVTVFLNTGQCH